MKDVNIFPAELLKNKELNEIDSKRTISSKTYSRGGNKFQLRKSIAPIHYKDDKGDFQEIDLTLQEDTEFFYTNKAMYNLKVFKNFIGYQYESKEGGRIDVKLKEIGGVNISDLNLNIKLEKVTGFPNRVVYKDVVPGLNLFLNLRGAKVQLFKVLKNSSAPVKLAWDIYEDKQTKAHFIPNTFGEDSNKKKIELTNEIEEIPTDKAFKHFVFKEEFKGRVAVKKRATRIKSWSTDVTYPVIIDADVEEDIVHNNDDGFDVGAYPTVWAENQNNIVAGYQSWYSWYQCNGGFRFQTIAIPQEATIDDANLVVYLNAEYGTPQLKVYGDDVDDASSFTDGTNLPKNITKTTASTSWSPSGTGSRSIAITGIVQEIVNRTAGAGWQSGNDMRFAMLDQVGSGSNNVNIYDYNAGATNSANLIVNYTAGAEYSKTLTETLSLTDSKLFSTGKVLTETLTLSDGDYYSPSRILSETLSLTDTLSTAWVVSKEYTETLSLSDDLDLSAERPMPGETLTLTDTLSIVGSFLKSLTETISLTDTYSRVWDLSREYTESLTLTDTVTPVRRKPIDLSETLSLSDTYSRVWLITKDLSETLSLTDNILKATNLLAMTETLSLTDSVSAGLGISLSETLSLSDTYSRVWSATKTLSETLSLSDGDIYSASIILSDTLNLTDTFSADWILSREYTETLSLTDTLTKSSGKVLSETLSLTDADILYSLGIILEETLTLTDTFSKIQTFVREYTETLTLTDGDTYSPNVVLEETLTLTDTFSKIWGTTQTLTETLSLIDTVANVKIMYKTLTETLTLTDGDTIKRTRSVTLTETLSLTPWLMGGIAKKRIIQLTEVEPIILHIPTTTPQMIGANVVEPKITTSDEVVPKIINIQGVC